MYTHTNYKKSKMISMPAWLFNTLEYAVLGWTGFLHWAEEVHFYSKSFIRYWHAMLLRWGLQWICTVYKCDLCHRSYGTKSRLKVHKRNMHQRIKCDECGQEICNSFILKRHKATVHGTRPTNVHQCDYCPLFYNRKSALDKHMVKHQAINQIW